MVVEMVVEMVVANGAAKGAAKGAAMSAETRAAPPGSPDIVIETLAPAIADAAPSAEDLRALRPAALTLAVDAEGRVLCQLRDLVPEILSPGLWHLFGGGVEADETRREAAAREFWEETGLTLDASHLSPFRWVRRRGGRDADVSIFRARLDAAPSQIRLGEGAGFALLTAEQVASFPFVPYAQRAIADHFAAPGF